MIDWAETRQLLIAAGIAAERLPEERPATVDLRRADLSGAYLRRADLRRADLSEADLRGAYLRGADLRGADLSAADLRGAYLSAADLSAADLSAAYLRGAYLSAADLRGADLSGAIFNWQSHDLIAEVLCRAAGDDIRHRMMAGLVLVSRDWCWDMFLRAGIDPALREWGLSVLRGWTQPGDNAPDVLTAAPAAQPQVAIVEPDPDSDGWLSADQPALVTVDGKQPGREYQD